MSHISQNLGLTVLENNDPADLTTVSDNFDVIDAVIGDIVTVERRSLENGLVAYRYGKLVVLRIVSGDTAISGNSGLIGTLPSGWRPQEQTTCAGVSAGRVVQVIASTNGNVNLYADSSVQYNYIRANMSFVVA